MADDEPLDDARQVGMAAAAAAARVVETVARKARDQAVQHRAMLERSQDQRRTQETLVGLQARYDSPAGREARDEARAAAGVPVEAWSVRSTADLMNGSDPALAAGIQPAAPVTAERTPPVVQKTQQATRAR